MGQALSFGQLALAVLEFLLRLLAILDIDRYSVPLSDVSVRIAQGRGTNQEPAIFTVSTPQTHFILGGFPSGEVRER